MYNERGFNLGMAPVKGADGQELYKGFALFLTKHGRGDFTALPCDIIDRENDLIRYKFRGLDWRNEPYRRQQTKFPKQFIMKQEKAS